jgi:biotin operon repressor
MPGRRPEKQNRVFDLLKYQPYHRMELASALGVSRGAVIALISDLQCKGVPVRQKTLQSGTYYWNESRKKSLEDYPAREKKPR